MDETRKQTFDNAFDRTLAFVQQRRERDADFTIDVLDGLLRTEYHNQDNSWDGKSLLQEATQDGVIAAYEKALAEWRKEG